MFQNKKKQELLNIKLPKLPSMPGYDDVSFLVIEAQRNRGRVVEMPWTNEDRSQSFMLTVKVDSQGGEPLWSLYKGEGSQAQVVWSYPSGDMSLILNLVMSECAGAVQEAMQKSSFAAPPKEPPGSSSSATTLIMGVSPQLGSVPAAPKAQGKASLEGELVNMQTPSLLQSITMSKMTGRLCIQGPSGMGEVFFEDGAPIHALAREIKGDLAITELILWEEGQFHFFPDERTAQKTVNKRLDTLLMEGVTVLDQCKYLSSQGLKPESYLLRKIPNLSEAEFEQRVAKGAPIDLLLQKRFYQAIDNQSSLFEILRKLPLSKPEWASVMFNMVNCGLVSLSDQAPRVVKAAPLEAMGIDRTAIDTIARSFVRPETGIFTYPAFLYSLEQEFLRFESFGWPFSLLIFEARMRTADNRLEPLPLTTVAELSKRLNTLKRQLDVLAHYETFDFALLLPNTSTAQAAMLANRMVETLLTTPLTPTMNPRALALAIGIACVPEDCPDLGMLLSAALSSKNQAKQHGSPVILYREIKGS